jgi:hypothetical protein
MLTSRVAISVDGGDNRRAPRALAILVARPR